MTRESNSRLKPLAHFIRAALLASALISCGIAVRAQEIDVAKKLAGFDAYME